MNEDERICAERHGNRVDFHEACHTCWKRRALVAEANAKMLAKVADRMREHEKKLDAVFRAANAHREVEKRVEWPWNEGYRIHDWQRTGAALDQALAEVTPSSRDPKEGG